MSINDVVQKAIEENLPAFVGKELKEFISNSEKLTVEYENLQQRFHEYNNKIVDLQIENTRLKNLEIDENNLKAREAQLAEDRRQFELNIAKSELAFEQRLSKQAFDMVGLVFRNTEIRKGIFDSESHNKIVNGHAGNNWQPHSENHNTTKQYNETETKL